jgi:hypothetical protein
MAAGKFVLPNRVLDRRTSALFNQPEVQSALREIGIASPAALLATWITDRAGLERYAAAALPVTDDRPRNRAWRLGNVRDVYLGAAKSSNRSPNDAMIED